MLIEGPVGAIEADWSERDRGAALLCHPHPLYGGSMHDMVLSEIDAGLASQGISSLRFNFRGVGASAGRHDKGVGEVEDVIFLANWLRERSDKIMLTGYSFGAMMVLNALDQAAPDGFLLVAPPVKMMEVTGAPVGAGAVILGEQDNIVEVDGTEQFFSEAGINVHRIPGADHFFMGAGDRIREVSADLAGTVF